MPPPPILVVVLCSDTARHDWAELASPAGAAVRTARDLEQLDAFELSRACGAVLAAPGAEEEAVRLVSSPHLQGVPQVVVVGSETGHRAGVAALRAGADDYFVLPGDRERVRDWISSRTEAWRAARRDPAPPAAGGTAYDFGWLLGGSPSLRATLERAAKVIPRGNATVLLTGETGTGKDLLAQAIHHNSPRASRPFVGVNCAAIPASLLESELFGHEKGAFTDARTTRPGLFEAAHGGTLFLDEIGDLSPDLQGKLLRVLEERRVRRLGSVRDLPVDVRIVAATHVDLAALTRAGRFRSDLYYRLNVVRVHIPPLRERGDDILSLSDHFLRKLGEEYGLPPPSLTPAVRRALLGHSWPGNVRELRNALERALVLGDGSIRVEDLVGEETHTSRSGPLFPFPASMEEIERAAAREMVQRCRGNKTQAAGRLGISRKRLYHLLREEEPPRPAALNPRG